MTRWARQMVKRDLYRLGPDGGLPGRGHVRAARALAAAAWHPGPRGRTVHARDSSCARYGRYACRDCLPAVPAGQQRRVRARGQRPKPKRADRLRRPVGHRRTCHVRLFGAWHVVARPPRLVATVARTHRLTAEATDRSPPRHEPPFPTGRGHGAFFVPRLARLHTACGQLCGVDHRSVNMLSVTLGGMALCRRGSEPRSGIGTGPRRSQMGRRCLLPAAAPGASMQLCPRTLRRPTRWPSCCSPTPGALLAAVPMAT